MATFLNRLDSQIEKLLTDWSIYSTILAIVFLTYLVYPLITAQEPDTHPFLLARQSSISHVRQPGESAIYRSSEVPQGYPLRTGLNVKSSDAPRWTSGRDGDLRDIWRQALGSGGVGQEGDKTGKIVSIMGKDAQEHDLDELTRQINIIGKYVQRCGGQRVAISIPNSVELLVAFFAASFYGFVPILIPRQPSLELLIELLRVSEADIVIASAGTLSPRKLAALCPHLKQAILVVEETSRQLGWEADVEGLQAVVEWHTIIQHGGNITSSDLPPSADGFVTPNVVTIWQKNNTEAYEIIEYTQPNMVAAIAAQISALPRNHRLGPSDTVLSLESISLMYPLIVTLAALYSNASIAVTSAAGPTADYDTAFTTVRPSIVVASAETMSEALSRKVPVVQGMLPRYLHSRQTQYLRQGTFRNANSPTKSQLPRLIFISSRAGVHSTPLSSADLNDLRILTGGHIIYALVAANVAGAVAQTNVFDYRVAEDISHNSHYGSPLSSLELKLVDTAHSKIQDEGDPIGQVVVTGPAVVGGEAPLPVVGRIREDGTLALA